MISLNNGKIEVGKHFNGEMFIKNFGNQMKENNEVKYEYNGLVEEDLAVILIGNIIKLRNKKASLILNYIPYSRQERDTENINVFSSFLDLLKNNYETTTLIGDIHSKDSLGQEINSHKLMVYQKHPIISIANAGFENRDVIVYPDKGALKRYNGVDNLPHSIITFDKERVNGVVKSNKINTSKINIHTKYNNLYVVDDICSGGATFRFVAEAIKESGVKYNKLILLTQYMERCAYETAYNKENISLYDEVIFEEKI
jgi:phosphoribosylpyrophosphate synthetase